ncbi:MAG: exonuclease SbcCD subunit D [Eubacterium sp.]|nr:exonuclease SbcCD subunit D [Eubacterium sp.]
MKLLHTSDWHLGRMEGNERSLWEDQKYAINEIYRIAGEEKADGILLAGDVFDRSIASTDAIKAFDEIIRHLCVDMDIPVYTIAGNHDGAERVSQHSRLLRKAGLHISGSLQREPFVVREEGVDIFLLPWITTDKVRSVFPEQAEEIRTMEDAFRVVLDCYREEFREGCRHILVAHAFIEKAETSESERATEVVGLAASVPAAVFDGFDYVALGHLHGYQRPGEHVYYSGTPMAYSFGREESHRKSVILYDTEADPDQAVRRIPVRQLHARATLTGELEALRTMDFAALESDPREHLEEDRLPEEAIGNLDEYIRNGYLRVCVTDRFVGTEVIAELNRCYPNILLISGRNYEEKEDSRISLKPEELSGLETRPEEVFLRYIRDMGIEGPEDRFLELFHESTAEYREEVEES